MSALVYGAKFDHADGDLWLATAAHLGHVVVKLFRRVPDPEALLDYGERLAAVRHPNLVRCYGVAKVPDPEVVNGRVFALIMAPVAGDVVNELLLGPPLRPQQTIVLATTAIDALQALHDAGLVHGDLHGGNVLVASDGSARVVDVLDHFTVEHMPFQWKPRQFALDVDHVRALVDTLIARTSGDSKALFRFRRATAGRVALIDLRTAVVDAFGAS